MNPVDKILGNQQYKPLMPLKRLKSLKPLRLDKSKNNSSEVCKVCKGTGKQTTTISTWGSDKEEKFESKCIGCEGTGRMTEEQLRHHKAYEDMWCKCKDKSDVKYAPDGTCRCGMSKHHYHCRKCGKITQIG
jgi:hypothetical protein